MRIINILKKIAQVTIAVSFIMYMTVLFAATPTPNPGHPWREVGDGWWAATGTTAYRTFTFPDASSTILTDNALVTVAQGGTGANSTSSAMNILSGLATKGDLMIRGSSIVQRLTSGINNQVLTADSATTTGVKWSTLTSSPAGSDKYIQFNDGGVFGGVSTLTFDKVAKSFLINGGLNITASDDPGPATVGTLNLHTRAVSGRMLTKSIGQFGVDVALQPSFFQNSIFMITTGAGTALNVVGNTLTTTGTISHAASEQVGYMAFVVTGSGKGKTAGTSSATAPYFIGSQNGSNGFFFSSRLSFPDATSTGLRVFTGLTAGTMVASVSADDPGTSGVGWHYSTSRGDTGWIFMTHDGATQSLSPVMLPMVVGDVFDFFIYAPAYPNSGTVYYRVDNITQGLSAEGSTSSNLPPGTTPLLAGFQLNNVVSGATSMYFNRLYVETDR